MHVLAASRPRNAADLPLLIWEGRGVCIVPTLMINIQPDQHLSILINTCINTTTARYFSTSIDQSDIGDWLDAWFDNPESVLSRLGWRWNASLPVQLDRKPATIASTLELDL